jgi:hypothetical protein
MTPEIRRQVASEMGKAGGKALAAKMTPEERSAAARRAAKARWAKIRATGAETPVQARYRKKRESEAHSSDGVAPKKVTRPRVQPKGA